MNMQADYRNEEKTAAAFTAQAIHFDELYGKNEIIRYKRERVRSHLLKLLNPQSRILELNAGTGEDAIFLARAGHEVHATDIAPGMLEKLNQKVLSASLQNFISSECRPFRDLSSLQNKGPYDCIFSNFAGLNCTGDLRQILLSFDELLKPGGLVTLVMLPKFCLWETLLLFRGKFRTAGRRFFSGHGRIAKIDQHSFTCWYYNPDFIRRILKDKYILLETEGLCTVVPPSYIEDFPAKHPKTYSRLCKIEDRVKNKWPWKSIGDYFIISFQKK